MVDITAFIAALRTTLVEYVDTYVDDVKWMRHRHSYCQESTSSWHVTQAMRACFAARPLCMIRYVIIDSLSDFVTLERRETFQTTTMKAIEDGKVVAI